MPLSQKSTPQRGYNCINNINILTQMVTVFDTGVRLNDEQSIAVMTCLGEKNVTILATTPDLIVGKCDDHTLVICMVLWRMIPSFSKNQGMPFVIQHLQQLHHRRRHPPRQHNNIIIATGQLLSVDTYQSSKRKTNSEG